MSKIIDMVKDAIAVSIAFMLLSSPLVVAEETTKAADTVEAEMTQAMGSYPSMIKALPEHLRAPAWDTLKARSNPNAAIPAKYAELIALGVAAQIPCNYCVYFHREKAKMLGASEAELQEAVASAAHTRHWSTVLNGAATDIEDFKAEFDKIFAYMKANAAK